METTRTGRRNVTLEGDKRARSPRLRRTIFALFLRSAIAEIAPRLSLFISICSARITSRRDKRQILIFIPLALYSFLVALLKAWRNDLSIVIWERRSSRSTLDLASYRLLIPAMYKVTRSLTTKILFAAVIINTFSISRVGNAASKRCIRSSVHPVDDAAYRAFSGDASAPWPPTRHVRSPLALAGSITSISTV